MPERKVLVDGIEISHSGSPPFVARSASDNTQDWPLWYVHGFDRANRMTATPGLYGGKFVPRGVAEKAAIALNEKGC